MTAAFEEPGEVPEPDHASGRRSMSFEQLYRRLRPSLLRYLARQMGGDQDGAEDVAQEAFVRLLERPDLDVDGARVWIFTVATNLLRDRARAGTRHRRLLDARPVRPAPPAPPPDELAERRENIARVRAALARLSDRDRQMLLMREEGFRYREIAEAVGVAPTSIGTLVARALKRFDDAFHREGE